MAARLLDSLRVLDFTQGFAEPYCTRMLHDLGAEVIEIEPPDGDRARRFPEVIEDSESGFSTQQNSGKKSVCLDLRQPAGIGRAEL